MLNTFTFYYKYLFIQNLIPKEIILVFDLFHVIFHYCFFFVYQELELQCSYDLSSNIPSSFYGRFLFYLLLHSQLAVGNNLFSIICWFIDLLSSICLRWNCLHIRINTCTACHEYSQTLWIFLFNLYSNNRFRLFFRRKMNSVCFLWRFEEELLIQLYRFVTLPLSLTLWYVLVHLTIENFPWFKFVVSTFWSSSEWRSNYPTDMHFFINFTCFTS